VVHAREHGVVAGEVLDGVGAGGRCFRHNGDGGAGARGDNPLLVDIGLHVLHAEVDDAGFEGPDAFLAPFGGDHFLD